MLFLKVIPKLFRLLLVTMSNVENSLAILYFWHVESSRKKGERLFTQMLFRDFLENN